MRIAIAASSDARVGGVETYLSDVIPALAERNEVACWFETSFPSLEPLLDGTSAVRRIGRSETAEGRPLRELLEWRPDVIYAHGLRSVETERALTAIAPVVFFAHSYYGACISGERLTRVPVQAPCTREFGPACLAQYLPRRCGGLSPLTMARSYAEQRARGRLLRQYHAVVVASRYMAERYDTQGISTRIVPLPVPSGASKRPGDRCRRVPAGSLRSGQGDSVPTLLVLSRLERSKGILIAVDAAAKAAGILNAPVRLVIAGRGSLERVVADRAAELRSVQPFLTVECTGWLAGDRRADALRSADLLLMPSLWPEPFGLVGLEAAAVGLPALAFAVGGIPEWLADGVTGRLVTPDRNPVGRFARAMADLLRDPRTLARMREAAASAAAGWSMERHLRELVPVLRDAARSASGLGGGG